MTEDQKISVYTTKVDYEADLILRDVKEFLEKEEDFLKLSKDYQDFLIISTKNEFVKEIKDIIRDFNK